MVCILLTYTVNSYCYLPLCHPYQLFDYSCGSQACTSNITTAFLPVQLCSHLKICGGPGTFTRVYPLTRYIKVLLLVRYRPTQRLAFPPENKAKEVLDNQTLRATKSIARFLLRSQFVLSKPEYQI